LEEVQQKWLHDDYVKFIRWGQWRIEETAHGVVALVTNHGYLDNPTFRIMREQLMRTFTDIYIFDLHGNIKKKEKPPEDIIDENVFDIKQGVAIGIFIKQPGKTGPAVVHHSEIWGSREYKYNYLNNTHFETTEWEKLDPEYPFYRFTPQDKELAIEYYIGWKLKEVFSLNSVGIVTARDNLTIHFGKEDLLRTLEEFIRIPIEEAREKYKLRKDVRDWKVENAQNDVRANGILKEFIVKIQYRPFDSRFTYYTGKSRGFIGQPQQKIMNQMISGDNLALISARSNKSGYMDHFFVTQTIMETKCGESTTQSCLFPIYSFEKEGSVQTSISGSNDVKVNVNLGRKNNLDLKFISDLASRLGLKFVSDGHGDLTTTFGPEDIFDYIYAIFHSPTYRQRYAEFLKIDFPRVPLTSSLDLFRKLCFLGEELVALHLLESPYLSQLITRYPVVGDNIVEKGFPKFVVYDDDQTGYVFINKTQYFEGVPSEVWDFHIGGYQVCEKWLKDRRGRQLSFDDLMHYQKVVVALKETIRLMEEIDKAIPKWPIE
jgi:predicted helicase